jgi:GMP synthase (glutamine-hydrolysing)
MPRLLVLDAYPSEGRSALRGAGGTEAGELYSRLLRQLEPEAQVDVAYPADAAPELPTGVELDDYDGMVWTGSSLTLWHHDDERVRRQIELARTAYELGIPAFGSCWAAQLAAAAAGGEVCESPKGREFGLARRIELSEEGRRHPLFAGREAVFDAWASHADMVSMLPASARLLASNDFAHVQALEARSGAGTFWALQYHPEYDCHEIAALARLRRDELVHQGHFADHGTATAWIDDMETLHRDPTRQDIAKRHGIGAEVLDPERRTREVRNWLEAQARPRAAAR